MKLTLDSPVEAHQVAVESPVGLLKVVAQQGRNNRHTSCFAGQESNVVQLPYCKVFDPSALVRVPELGHR